VAVFSPALAQRRQVFYAVKKGMQPKKRAEREAKEQPMQEPHVPAARRRLNAMVLQKATSGGTAASWRFTQNVAERSEHK